MNIIIYTAGGGRKYIDDVRCISKSGDDTELVFLIDTHGLPEAAPVVIKKADIIQMVIIL